MSIYASEEPEVVAEHKRTVRAAEGGEYLIRLRSDCVATLVCHDCLESYEVHGRFQFFETDEETGEGASFFTPHDCDYQCAHCGSEDYGYVAFGADDPTEIEAA